MASNIQLLDGGVVILPPRTPRPAVMVAVLAGLLISTFYAIVHVRIADRDSAFIGFAIAACCAVALLGFLCRRVRSAREAIWIADSPGAIPPKRAIVPERTYLSSAVRGLRIEFEPERGEPRDGHFYLYVDLTHSAEPLLLYAARRSFLRVVKNTAQTLAERWQVPLANQTSF